MMSDSELHFSDFDYVKSENVKLGLQLVERFEKVYKDLNSI